MGRAEPSREQLKTQTARSQGRGASCSRCQTAPTTGMCFHAGTAWKSKNTKGKNFILFTICVWRNGAEEQTPFPSCHSTVAPIITRHPPKLYFRLRTGRSPGSRDSFPPHTNIVAAVSQHFHKEATGLTGVHSHSPHIPAGRECPWPPRSAVSSKYKGWKEGNFILRGRKRRRFEV